LGYKVEERIGATGFELIHPEDLKFLTGKFNDLITSTTPLVLHFEMRLRHKDGSWRIVEAVGSNLINNNVVESIIVNYRDITDRKRAEEVLKETDLKFRTIFESASDGIIILHVGSREFSDVNEQICSLLGYTKEEFLKLSVSDIHPPESLPYVMDQMEKHIRKEILIAKNIPMLKKDKTKFFADVSASMISFHGEEYLVGRFRDMTERKLVEDALRESEQKYQELSILDDLTKLFNSRHFYDQLKKEMARSTRYGQPLSLMLLDLDRFKEFNDKYGHIEGDNVLSRLGQIIKGCLRETDSAYRYGGEEFTIILPMTTAEEGVTTAKRIHAELRQEAFTPLSGQENHITASIGLAQYKFKEELKAFVHRVDQLMYEAKKGGGDRICINHSGRNLH
jgi:diguanylate cyclase (GGDEF)-like protein/PAS domain S-box-containing protein